MTDQQKLLALLKLDLKKAETLYGHNALSSIAEGAWMPEGAKEENARLLPVLRELLADNERLAEALKCYKHLHMSSYHDRNLATRDSWPIAQEALETHQATMKKLLKEE